MKKKSPASLEKGKMLKGVNKNSANLTGVLSRIGYFSNFHKLKIASIVGQSLR